MVGRWSFSHEQSALACRGGGDQIRLSGHALLVALCVGALNDPTPALAADGPTGAPASRQSAQANQARDFSIPSQPLSTALDRFADQAGVAFAYKTSELSDLRSPGISGSLTPAAALQRLLSGTGVTFQFIDARTVMLTRPAPSSAVVLDPVTVEGAAPRETAWGPVNGYVATRSETATKTDAPLIEIPQSISVITRDQMNDRNTQSLNDTLRYTAGVQAGDTNDLTTESFTLRGFNSPYLSLHRDGTRAMFRAFDSVIEPYGLERVEVLRGPASVLYGQGVPGGVINVVTKRPTETPLGEILLQAGSHDRFQGGLDLSGPLTDDKTVRYRVTAMARDAETQTDFVSDDRVYLAPALSLHSPTGDTNFTLLTSYQHDKTSFPDGLPAAGIVLPNPNGTIPTSRFTGEPDWSKFERSSYSAGYIFDHRLSETFSLHQNLSYTVTDYDRNQIQNRGFDPALRAIDRRARQGFQDSQRVNVDTRVEAKFGSDLVRHDVIAGVDYGWTLFKTKMNQGAIDPLDLFNPTYGAPVSTPDPVFNDSEKASQFGLYLQEQMKIDDSLILVGGLRQDWAEDSLTDRLVGVTSKQRDNAMTFRLGAVYLTPIGLAPYASFSQSFVPLSGSDAEGRQFDSETGEQYEIGVKYQPKGFNSFITLSLFHLARQNVQTPDPADPDFLVQTGEVITKGVELEGVASLTNNLSLIGTYSYTDAEVTESNDIDLGKIPTAVPKHMASLWGDYSVKQGDLAGLSAGLGVRYIGKMPGDAANSFFVPDVTVMDAALRYQLGSYRFALNVSNLFDKEYASVCFSESSCYYGQRRTVIGSVSYNW